MAELTISDQVKAGIKRKGTKKFKIAEWLGISRPTFNSRLRKNEWEASDITILKQKGIVI